MKTSRSRIKRLREMGRPQFRLRVGNIRVYYDVLEGTVELIALVPKPQAASWLSREGRSE
jgi:mRNA-degrading endonuclease RelE of RelBE toxin-antitoxin system